MKIKHFISLFIAILFFSHCNKEFLDKKQNSNISVPSTLSDFQKLLDVDSYFKETPMFGEVSSDDYYVISANYNSITSIPEKNAHIWNKQIYDGSSPVPDWNLPYQQVFYANVVLDGMPSVAITTENRTEWNAIKGSALFLRSNAFYNLSQIFSPVYDQNSASTKMGIPLRLSANIDEITRRSTVKDTYDRIISDLVEAKDLLPVEVPKANRNRPSKAAAYALLARVYLSMRDYDNAGKCSDSSLKLYNKLIDYNTLSLTAAFPFTILNDETLYQSTLLSTSEILQNVRLTDGYFIDSNLYKSYSINDLRKTIFFSTVPRIKGSYAERPRFSGLATDEVYLIRAECKARENKFTDAMKDLNDLLRTRWKKVNNQTTFVDYTAANGEDALRQVLIERRKELIFRGLRWSDLRRLNIDGAGITLKRVLDGVTYTLPPNDPRYVAPIPNDVIAFTGIEQNPR